MLYKIAADGIVVIHFLWILFMIGGFLVTLVGFFRKSIFDWWLFRTLHLCGILYVGLLTVLQQYCPLTVLENALRARHDPESAYPGSFIVHHLENLVYPDVNPNIIVVPTLVIAVLTAVIFVLRPPHRQR